MCLSDIDNFDVLIQSYIMVNCAYTHMIVSPKLFNFQFYFETALWYSYIGMIKQNGSEVSSDMLLVSKVLFCLNINNCQY